MDENFLARAESALFEHTTEREEALIREAESAARELGAMFSASGAVDPGESIKMQRLRKIWNGSEYQRFREGLLTSAPPPACANCGLRWSL